MKESKTLLNSVREQTEPAASFEPTSSLPATHGSSTFFSLPPEIRDYVYQLALINYNYRLEEAYEEHWAYTVDSYETLNPQNRYKARHGPDAEYYRTGLFLVNKQFYYEASRIFYTRFSFIIGSYLMVDDVTDFLVQRLPSNRLSEIRKIRLAVVISIDGNTSRTPTSGVPLTSQVEAFELTRQLLPGLAKVQIRFGIFEPHHPPFDYGDSLYRSVRQATRPFKGVAKIEFEWAQMGVRFSEFQNQYISNVFERMEDAIGSGADW